MKRNINRNLALNRSNPARLRSPIVRREAPSGTRTRSRAASSPRTSKPGAPDYQLRRGHGFWSLTFASRSAVLKHEQGLNYVAWLLAHPNDAPIHALDLATRLRTSALQNASDYVTRAP